MVEVVRGATQREQTVPTRDGRMGRVDRRAAPPRASLDRAAGPGTTSLATAPKRGDPGLVGPAQGASSPPPYTASP